jgi:S1-C subfamily serine protease
MDTSNKLSGGVKAVGVVALVLALTGALVLLAAEKAAPEMKERGFLGVTVQSLGSAEREDLGVKHGVQVAEVEKGSAAEKAGVLKDDVILSVNGEKIRDAQALAEIVREQAPGSAVKIGLWRKNSALEVKAVLGKLERSRRAHWSVAPLAEVFRSRAYLGVNLLDLDADLAAYFSVKAGEGVLVSSVAKDTPAEKAGLKAGDVIVKMNDNAVKESGDIHEALAALKKGDSVTVTVVRHGQRQAIKVEPDFDRHERVLRYFGKGKELEIGHLELPDMEIGVPEFDMEAPEPPEPPDAEEIVLHVHEKMEQANEKLEHAQKKMDQATIKIERRLKEVVENSWI